MRFGLPLLLLSLTACASPQTEEVSAQPGIRIQFTGVPVNDQDRAEKFYTEMLGFEVVTDIPVGPYRWLSVGSPAGIDGVEFLLEPNANPATQTYQAALYEQGIPYTMFMVDDMEAVHAQLVERGVQFKVDPTEAGTVIIAMFDDTCGNLIQLTQQL